jgi:hypothetical protein
MARVFAGGQKKDKQLRHLGVCAFSLSLPISFCALLLLLLLFVYLFGRFRQQEKQQERMETHRASLRPTPSSSASSPGRTGTVVLAKSAPVCAVTRTLRPRHTAEPKPNRTRRQTAAGRQRWKRSWVGLEEKREALRALARRVRESDSVVRELIQPSVLATGAICQAIREPSTASCPEVARAAQAQRELREMHGRRLVWENGLDWFFVRVEWFGVLEPQAEVGAPRADSANDTAS